MSLVLLQLQCHSLLCVPVTMVSSLYLLLGAAATVLATRPHAHTKRQCSVASTVTKTVAGDNTATSMAGAATSSALQRYIDLYKAQNDYLIEGCMPTTGNSSKSTKPWPIPQKITPF